jgi:hypothetical protein
MKSFEMARMPEMAEPFGSLAEIVAEAVVEGAPW